VSVPLLSAIALGWIWANRRDGRRGRWWAPTGPLRAGAPLFGNFVRVRMVRPGGEPPIHGSSSFRLGIDDECHGPTFTASSSLAAVARQLPQRFRDPMGVCLRSAFGRGSIRNSPRSTRTLPSDPLPCLTHGTGRGQNAVPTSRWQSPRRECNRRRLRRRTHDKANTGLAGASRFSPAARAQARNCAMPERAHTTQKRMTREISRPCRGRRPAAPPAPTAQFVWCLLTQRGDDGALQPDSASTHP